MLPRHLLITILLLSSIGYVNDAQAQEKKKYEDPTPRKEAILKRFVAEFVTTLV